MRILFLPKYPRIGASSRLRTYQFIPFWENKDYQVDVSSFFNETYLTQVYAHRRPDVWNVIRCYFRRFLLLLTSRKYDLIWIEKEAFPFLPSYAEWLLNKLGKGYVVDYDDAVFHNYDQHSNWLIRTCMGNKIDWVMRNSRLTIAGNEYLKSRALNAGAAQVIQLPTVIDPSRYFKKNHFQKTIVTIGWIGSPSTLKYVDQLAAALDSLDKKAKIQLLLVNGVKEVSGFSGKQVLVPWSEETEVASILEMDIGIMPLPDDQWEQGKCAYKLIQYMACGLPVVASPVGMNKEVVAHGKNGFLAETEAEWIHYLGQLIADPLLRAQMGRSGRELIEKEYTIQRNFEKMHKALNSLLLNK